ncbi:MAG: 4-hydroxy-tetrahydrodipicolinate reductase [Sphaerochaetaceae bacterium]|jgi:4-hydroxy-tetrahydrodipicolinate reductase
MLRVILNGCSGRMGKVLTTQIKTIEGMEVVAGIDLNESPRDYPIYKSLQESPVKGEVMIDFSSSTSLKSYLPVAIERGLALVVATTGLDAEDEKLLKEASNSIPIFRSQNMSLGINLVQELLQSATKVLGERYDVEIIEKHHRYKKDSPSGTALMLAESINAVRTHPLTYVYGRVGNETLRKKEELGIHSLRGGTYAGEHEISFSGEDEVIAITHQSYSRQVFANGAIAAAHYIVRQKRGLYSMHDMILESSAVTTIYTEHSEVLISLDNMSREMEKISDLYGFLAANDIFIDMISHTGATNGNIALSFTIKERDRLKAEALLGKFLEPLPGAILVIEKGVSKITVEGPGMEYQSGVASRLFAAMAKAKIPILAVTTSERKIAYITPEAVVERAVAIIKEEFNI